MKQLLSLQQASAICRLKYSMVSFHSSPNVKNKFCGYIAILIWVAIAGTSTLKAQALKGHSAEHILNHTLPASVDTAHWPKRPYDVLSYQLLLDWRHAFTAQEPIFSGHNLITLQLTDNVDTVVLNAAEMRIDSVSINGLPLASTPPLGFDSLPWGVDMVLRIPLPVELRQKGTILSFGIGYTRTSNANDGFYFYPKGTYVGLGPSNDSIFVEEDLAYTMSEPLDAHKWMPCADLPYDKANSAISIIVPTGYSAQSNGTLQSVDSNADGSHTYNWKSDEPIATYLMVGDASKFIEFGSSYHRLSNPNDSVPVVDFVWPPDYYQTQDTTGLKYNAQYALRNVPKMLAAFSKRFGEYPFKQYGEVVAQPFGGGMEHQSMTTFARSWLRGYSEDGIAHELMHQWFGDKTTCETWADLWLNEGFATYGEAVWEESEYGHSAYEQTMQTQAAGYFNPYGGDNTIPIYNPPIDNMFNDPTTYLKPGCVLHMLRRMLDNDTLFFGTLRDYSSAFAYSTANTFQFRDFIETRAGSLAPMSLLDFIDEWIFQPDFPVYTFTWAQDSKNLLTLRVVQSQHTTDHYTMPLRFQAKPWPDTTELIFLNNQRTQFFTLQLDHPIDSLIFDESAVIISKFKTTRDQNLAVAEAPTEDPQLRVSEWNGTTTLSFAPIATDGAALRIFDVLGRTVFDQTLLHGNTTLALPANIAASGDYFAVLMDGPKQAMVKLRLLK